ncbi:MULTISPECIES: cell wall hydrolase [unclassified Brevundimonas]|uniref:cell wall hydrolase n=1 Tax=unclassified Brevundimonas TaxID=2622653 RepID=UPI0025B80DFC|nr:MULTISPECIES: cell wall hydrolase [unclassified Brevundimonas]
MRGVASVLIAGGLGCAVWAGLANHARFAQAEPGAVKPIPAYAAVAVEAPVESDKERRARLNVRLQTMIKDGKGVRLTDAPPPVRRRAEIRPSAPAARMAATPSRAEPAASFAPPPVNANAAPSVRRTGYTRPYLDLKTPPRVPDNDLECLTQAIYYEARNESEAGQAAVAEVVLNRSRHRAYPKRVCEVVYQRNSRTCQFTFTCDGSIGRRAINPVAWARAERIAREVYEGRSASQLPKNSVNYHANYVRPSWGSRLARVRQIGAHIFYGAPLNGGTNPGAWEREREPARSGLLFVRNDALDRAYTLMTAQAAPSEPSAPAGS